MISLTRICLTLTAVAGLLSIGYGADWPAFRGNDSRTGFYPDPVGLPSGPPAWKTWLGGQIISSPAVVDNILYIGSRDSCVYAIDCGSGAVLWKTKTGGWVDASPLVTGNRVVVGSRDSIVYVLDKASGEVLGRLSAGVQLSSPGIAADGSILSGVGVGGGGMSAFGSATLSKRLSGPQWSIGLPQFTYSSPAIHGQAVVIGATDGKLYCIDSGIKDTIWSMQTGGLIYLSTPAIDNTTVYFAPGDDDRNVYAVDLLTGRILWKSGTVSPAAQIALTKKRTVRIVSPEGLVRLLRMSPALRKRTIQSLRSQGIELPRVPRAAGLAKIAAGVIGDFIPLGGMKTSSVTVGADNVYVVQKDLGYVLSNDSLVDYKQQFGIVAMDKRSGTLLWSFGECRNSPALGYCSSPVATKNMVYFGWGEGRIYGLDAKSGALMWQDSLDGHIISSPAIANGKLYVATMAGSVYAYDLCATRPGMDFQTSTYCYPNPARGTVSHIQVYVAKAGVLEGALYNFAQKPVLRFSGRLSAGEKYSYDWNISHVANGVYFALIKVSYSDGSIDKKLLKVAVLH